MFTYSSVTSSSQPTGRPSLTGAVLGQPDPADSLLAHLGNIVARTGRPLAFDPAAESIPGDPEANRLLTRQYRPHWSTPVFQKY